MIKEIITDLNKLSEGAEEIKDIVKENKTVQQIVIDLKDTIREKNIPALAAPQIGYQKRIFVINFAGDLKTFVDPIINYSNVEGMGLSIEECPSIPHKKYLMIRNSKIEVMYMTPLGQPKGYKLHGMGAYTFQRMMNLLDGVVLSDMGLEVDDDFINASEEEKEPIINAFLDALDIKRKALNEDIDKSNDLSEIRDAGKFLNEVQKGNIHVVTTQEKLPKVKKSKAKENNN